MLPAFLSLYSCFSIHTSPASRRLWTAALPFFSAPPRKLLLPTSSRFFVVFSGAIVSRGSGPQTRYFLNHPAFEPIEGISEGINDAVFRLVSNHPGRGVPFLRATLQASRSTVERAIAALVAAGAIEHRGSRKTGGYWLKAPTDSPRV